MIRMFLLSDIFAIGLYIYSNGEGNGNPLQYSCLENPMDRGAWQATVHGGCKVSEMAEQLSSIYSI